MRIENAVKAVLFDLGRTITRTVDFPGIYKRILETYGIEVSSEDVVEAHRANDDELDVLEGQIELGQDF